MKLSDLFELIVNNPEKCTKKVYFNSTKNVRYETEPKLLYNYNEVIADLHNKELIIIYDKTARGGEYHSQTTSTRVNDFIRFCQDSRKLYELIDFKQSNTES
tara:strand:- start:627 stop:932 length:306 start_codon:yes stop_codon:yes gene_type:complete